MECSRCHGARGLEPSITRRPSWAIYPLLNWPIRSDGPCRRTIRGHCRLSRTLGRLRAYIHVRSTRRSPCGELASAYRIGSVDGPPVSPERCRPCRRFGRRPNGAARTASRVSISRAGGSIAANGCCSGLIHKSISTSVPRRRAWQGRTASVFHVLGGIASCPGDGRLSVCRSYRACGSSLGQRYAATADPW